MTGVAVKQENSYRLDVEIMAAQMRKSHRVVEVVPEEVGSHKKALTVSMMPTGLGPGVPKPQRCKLHLGGVKSRIWTMGWTLTQAISIPRPSGFGISNVHTFVIHRTPLVTFGLQSALALWVKPCGGCPYVLRRDAKSVGYPPRIQ